MKIDFESMCTPSYNDDLQLVKQYRFPQPWQHLPLVVKPGRQGIRMSSNQNTVDFLMKQIAGAGNVSARKMFGEYGVYCDGKMVASICENQLFLKPTESARAYIGQVIEAPPYPGARLSFLIPNDRWGEKEWLCELIRITIRDLPVPKKKNGK